MRQRARLIAVFLSSLIVSSCAPPVRIRTVGPSVPIGLETVSPSDVLGLHVCGDATWNGAKWYIFKDNGAPLAWAGPLVPAVDPGCYDSPKVYQFAAGAHTVDAQLVNHCAASDPAPWCQPGCSSLRPDLPCEGDTPSAVTSITFTSAVQDVRPPAPTAAMEVYTCRVVVSAMPPDASTGWAAQFKAGDQALGSVDRTPPYTRTVSTVKPGTYIITVEWTKSGLAAVVSQPVTVTCP